MKKIKIFMLSFVLIGILTSCFNSERYDVKSSISSPKLNDTLLNGTWEMIDRKSYNLDTKNENESSEIEKLYIDKDLFEIGNKFTLSPKIEAKYMSSKSYFNSNDYPNLNIEDIIKDEFINIIMVLDDGGFYQELVKIDEDHIFLLYDGYQYLFKKISNSVDEKVYEKYKNGKIKANTEAYNGKVGLSLTIKSIREMENGKNSINYMTYYIYYDNSVKGKTILNPYERDGIFLPKKNTFNLITYDENWDKDEYKGILRDNVILESDVLEEKNIIYDTDVPIEINGITDKFYSFSSSDEIGSINKFFRIRLVDSKTSDKSLNIEDVSGEEGYKVLKETINKEKEKYIVSEEENSRLNNYTNIGIIRNNGAWQFRTSLLFNNDSEQIYKDLNLNIIPKLDIIKNDPLDKSWKDVKNINENAIDMIYSPNENFYIILDNNYIYFYSIVKNNYLTKIELDDGVKSIIKADWAIGTNADTWRDYIIKSGGTIIE